MSYTWLVTGSSRGIGFETVKQLLAVSSNTVFATCRNPDTAPSLQSLNQKSGARLHIVKLDLDDEKSILDAFRVVKGILGEQGLDYLINNAAITEGYDTAFTMSISGLTKTFRSNVAGPALVAQVFLPLVEKSKRKVIVNTSTTVGSFGKDMGTVVASYSISKAALNMLTYKQAHERPDLIVFALNPGWVRTDMGGAGVPAEALEAVNKIKGEQGGITGPIEPSVSVSNIIKTVTSATAGTTGKFLNYTGDELPW